MEETMSSFQAEVLDSISEDTEEERREATIRTLIHSSFHVQVTMPKGSYLCPCKSHLSWLKNDNKEKTAIAYTNKEIRYQGEKQLHLTYLYFDFHESDLGEERAATVSTDLIYDYPDKTEAIIYLHKTPNQALRSMKIIPEPEGVSPLTGVVLMPEFFYLDFPSLN